jgi:hypothetical protein
MRKFTPHLAAMALAFFATTATFAQSNLNIVHTDTVRLEVPAFNGSIQWQESTDGQNWVDIADGVTNPFAFAVNLMPRYFRANILQDGCEPYYSETLSVISSPPSYYWSDPNAWGGAVPVEGQDVLIPMNRRILLDVTPPPLGGLTINGTLEFMPDDLGLTAEWIMVHGSLQVGSESVPFTHQATITLTGDDPQQSIMGMGNRGVMVMGGALELHGTPPSVPWTKIDAHAPATSTSLTLMETVDWQADDEIVVGPTDYFLAGNGASVSQAVTLTSASGNALQLAEGLNAHRWGLLQYATASGMSLSPANLLTPPAPDNDTASTPLILDQRAPVGSLSRNIVIQCPDDALWQDEGFGVHVMVMGTGAQAHLNGVEIRRGGQRGRLGRYAFHWHMLSYSGTQTLADATGQYIRNSVINRSANRGIVIHGTNGVEVSRNVVFHIEGHGIFTEDAVERRNLIDGNLVLHVRNPNLPPNLALKQHEVGERGSSGFWISNPDNILTNNTAADCGTNGFWLAFPANPWGESANVLGANGQVMNPSRILFGTFDNNTAHSNGREGIMLDNVEIDEAGNTFPWQYQSTINGQDIVWPWSTLCRFSLSNYKVWKNGSHGIWDRAIWPDNFGAVSADNCDRFFAGSGQDGVIEKSLVIGTSLNHMMNGTDRPPYGYNFPGGADASTPVAFATYHSSFDIRDNIAMNFPAVESTWSGVFSTDDYYIRPVEKGQFRNLNNLIINAHPGVKLRAAYDYFTLASAIWDPHGTWGPQGQWLVYDEPFLTHGKPITQVTPSTAVSGGVSVPGPFYGFEGFVLHGVGDVPPQNQPYMDLMGIHVRRLDSDLNEVATWTVDPAPAPNALLQHMRDFATSPDGIYELTFPWETDHPTDFQMNVENMLTEDDVQVIGIQYDGSLSPAVWIQTPGSFQVYDQLNSLQQVITSDGETWWQDTANNRVWVKLRGGRWQFWTNNPQEAVPTGDDLLYEGMVLRVRVP